MKSHRTWIALALGVGLLVTASAVLAGTTASLRGNPRPNTLRGTPAADSIWGLAGNDKLYGGAGNDKLYGGAGNDLLVGGAGADVMSCGAGNDRVGGGAGDKAARDCEHVSGIPKPTGGGTGGGEGGGGSPAPPPPKATCENGMDDDGDGKIDYPADRGCESAADTDETDPAAPVTAGSYKGATQEGNFVFFTVTSDRKITGFRLNAVAENCEPGGTLRGSVDWGDSRFASGNDGRFTAQGNWTGSEKNGDSELTSSSWTVTGSFSGGSASGTVTMSAEANYNGTHYRCSAGEVKWTAAVQS